MRLGDLLSDRTAVTDRVVGYSGTTGRWPQPGGSRQRPVPGQVPSCTQLLLVIRARGPRAGPPSAQTNTSSGRTHSQSPGIRFRQFPSTRPTGDPRIASNRSRSEPRSQPTGSRRGTRARTTTRVTPSPGPPWTDERKSASSSTLPGSNGHSTGRTGVHLDRVEEEAIRPGPGGRVLHEAIRPRGIRAPCPGPSRRGSR